MELYILLGRKEGKGGNEKTNSTNRYHSSFKVEMERYRYQIAMDKRRQYLESFSMEIDDKHFKPNVQIYVGEICLYLKILFDCIL